MRSSFVASSLICAYGDLGQREKQRGHQAIADELSSNAARIPSERTCQRRQQNESEHHGQIFNDEPAYRDAAVEEGIVPGGGVMLLKATKAITVKGDNEDQEAGINIVRRALQAPIRQIADNAGVEGSIVVGKVMDERSASFGYDAQTDEYGDMIEKASSTLPRSCASPCRMRRPSPP